MSDALIGALIGLAGLLLGLLSSEHFRRRSRIEGYSKEIFLKRLEVYEILYEKMNTAAMLASEFEKESIDDVETLVSMTHSLVLETAKYSDEKGLYINEEVFIQYMLTLMLLPKEGTPEELERFRQEKTSKFSENVRITKLMIKEETGLTELDRLFKGITRAKHSSEYVKYFRHKKKEYGIRD